LAQEAASDYDTLVAVGGDGTISEVADGILASSQKEVALGVVPFGTGNDIARGLGISNMDDCIRALSQAHPRFIDVIDVCCSVNGSIQVKHALLFAGVGIIGKLLKFTGGTQKRWFGPRLAYRVGLVRALWSYQPQPMRITCAGQTFDGSFLLACASNAETAGAGIPLAPGARLDDGLLNVNLIAALSRWKAMKQLRALSRGRHIGHPNVKYLTTTSVTVETDAPIDVAADGDLVGFTPARFEVRSKALQVLAWSLS
jgi:YegS/Rv2252/BmrU family lipid kinase